jgi:predicted PurR-regulated permease PerM
MGKAFFSYLNRNQFIAGIIFLAVILLIYQLKEILLIIFVAYIIVAALNPVVEYLRKRRVPKTVAVLITFFVTLLLFVLLIAPLVPFLVSQIQQLTKSFPLYLHNAAHAIGVQLEVGEIGRIVTPQQLGQNAFALAGGVFGGFFAVVTTIAISFYLLLSYEKAKSGVANLFSLKHRKKTIDIIDQINDKLGAWLQGQFLLSLSIGLLTWITLTLLQMPFALPLAVLAGIFEIVPSIGPIISAVPAVVVALTISPNMAFIIIAAYIFIQLVENHLLVPRIMQRAVGLNPVVVIVGVVVGDKLLGIPGALLSVPFISLIVLIAKNIGDLTEE